MTSTSSSVSALALRDWSRHHLWASLCIVVLCFVVYGNSLSNKYALDDDLVILQNPRIHKGLDAFPQIFFEHYSQSAKSSYGFRPITLATFALEYHLFGENPHVGHLINILLYALTCILLYFLLLRLFREYHWSLSALAVILFIIHPIHTEVVNNIKSRDELLAFLFAIAAMRSFIYAFDHKKVPRFGIGILFGTLLFMVSLLAKTTSAPFFVIIPFTLIYYLRFKWWKVLAATSVIIFGLIVVRYGIDQVLAVEKTRELLYFENPLFQEQFRSFNGFATKLPMAFYTTGFYLKMMVVPQPLLFYYGYSHMDLAGWDNGWTWVSMIIILTSVFFILKKFKSREPWVYGAIFFFLFAATYSNLISAAVGIVAERFIYMGSLGFCIVLAWFIFKLCKVEVRVAALVNRSTAVEEVPLVNRSRMWMIFGGMMILPFALFMLEGTAIRALGVVLLLMGMMLLLWLLNTSKKSVADHHGFSVLPKWNALFVIVVGGVVVLGSMRTVVRNPNWKDKMTLFRHDIQDMPNSAKGHALIAGTIVPEILKEQNPQVRQQMVNEAIVHFGEAIRIYPDYHTMVNNLGVMHYSHRGDFQTAFGYFNRALEIKPDYVEAHHNAGACYEQFQRNADAIVHFYVSLGFHQHYHEAYGAIGKYMQTHPNFEYQEVAPFRKKNATAHYWFGRVYQALGEEQRAMGHYLKTLQLARDYPLSWTKLSSALIQEQRYDEAHLHNRIGVKVFPRTPEFFLNIGNVYSAQADVQSAIVWFERGYEHTPNIDLANHLFQLHRNEGNVEKAAYYKQQMRELQGQQ